MERSGSKSRGILRELTCLFVTTVISVGNGQEEPRERARRPSKVREQSTIQKEKISQTSIFATEAARQKSGPLKAMLFVNQNGEIVRCFNSLMDEGANS